MMYPSCFPVRSGFAILGALALTSATAIAGSYPGSPSNGKSSQGPASPVLNGAFTTPVPLFSLPTIFPQSTAAQNPIDYNEIRNTLSLYPLAVDGKNFGSFSKVFTSNVVANLSQGGLIHGLPALEGAVSASFVHVTTQHQLGTQYIDIVKEGREAESVTYFTATLLGTGKFYGQVSAFLYNAPTRDC